MEKCRLGSEKLGFFTRFQDLRTSIVVARFIGRIGAGIPLPHPPQAPRTPYPPYPPASRGRGTDRRKRWGKQAGQEQGEGL